MVNAPSPNPDTDRRAGRRVDAAHAPALGATNLNPFGDLHTVQHLSARLARAMRLVFEPMLRRGLRSWAEPVEVDRFAAHGAARAGRLTAWVPLTFGDNGAQALLVLDGRFLLEALDLFFGGTGDTPAQLPTEFSPAAEAMVRRIAAALVGPLGDAWAPVAPLSFVAGNPEANSAMLQAADPEDPVIVTRFGLASGDGTPAFVDIVYPVAALKPHAPSLNTRVHARAASPDARWVSGLTRAAMGVRFPVRSVLAEPVISLGRLMALTEGDVIPISFGQQVPVMVGQRRLGTGTVGTANGRAAIRIHAIDQGFEEDFQ